MGIEKYKEIFNNDKEDVEIEPTNYEILEIIEDTKFDENIGIVYLMRSKNHWNTYKIGITNRTVEDRLYELLRNPTYGSYNLFPAAYIKLKNYNVAEQVYHKYFENFRLCRKNDLFIDTELFQTNEDLINEFKYFCKVNYLEHPRLKKEVLDYREY